MTLTSFDKKMFDKAKSVAEKSTYKYHSIGCVIVYHRRIIATAANPRHNPIAITIDRKKVCNLNVIIILLR